MNDPQQIWEQNYRAGRYNRYPYDAVVSFVLRHFGQTDDRRAVSILDLGCGGGNHVRFLDDEGFTGFAIDGSAESVRLARGQLGSDSAKSRVYQGDFRELPFEADRFDAVIDRQSMGHNYRRDIEKIVREVHRVLKPGGRYFGIVFSAEHPDLQFGRRQADGDFDNFAAGRFRKTGVVHGFLADELTSLFKGFTLESVKLGRVYDLLAAGEPLDHAEITIIARKPN